MDGTAFYYVNSDGTPGDEVVRPVIPKPSETKSLQLRTRVTPSFYETITETKTKYQTKKGYQLEDSEFLRNVIYLGCKHILHEELLDKIVFDLENKSIKIAM